MTTTNMKMPQPAIGNDTAVDIPNLATDLQTIDTEFGNRGKNLLWYGASGSAQTTTASMTSGSATATLASAIDFKNGQKIAVLHAGPGPYQVGTSTALTAPTGLSVTNEGTAGTTTYKYYIAATDDLGGITAVVSVSTTTGNATLSQSSANYNKIAWTAPTGAFGYAIWGDPSNPSTSQGLLGVTGNTFFLDMGLGADSMGMGAGTSVLFPASAPTSALGQTLFTSISSGAGTTTLTLANTASATISGESVFHDDTDAINTALTNPSGFSLYIPPGTYYTRSEIDIASPTQLNISGVFGQSIIMALPGNTGNIFNITSGNGVHFSNLVVDGNKLNNTFGTSEELQNGIRLIGCTYSSVGHIEGRNTWMTPVKLGGASGTGTQAGSQRCIVDSCFIHDGYDQGIGVWNSEHCVVSNNVVENSGWAGISLTQSNRCTVTGNTSNENKYLVNYYNVEGHGIALEGADGNTVTGNTCESNNAWGIHVGVGPFNSANCTNNVISSNVVRGSQNGQPGIDMDHADSTSLMGNILESNAGQGIFINQNATNTVIEGGVITGNSKEGVGVAYGSVTVRGVRIYSNTNQGINIGSYGANTDVSIEGNMCYANGSDNISVANTTNFTVTGNQATSSSGGNGIILSACVLGNCNGNTAEGNNAQGIITLSCTKITVTGNTSTNNGGNGGFDMRGIQNSTLSSNVVSNNRGMGISLSDNSTTYSQYNTLQNNVCIDDQGTPTQTYGINEEGNSNYNRFLDNDCRGNTTSQLMVIGANSTQTNGNRTA